MKLVLETTKKYNENLIKCIRKNIIIESILFKKDGFKDKLNEIELKLICKLIMVKYPNIMYPTPKHYFLLKKYNLQHINKSFSKEDVFSMLFKSVKPILYKDILNCLQHENCNNKIESECKETVLAYSDEDILKIYKKFIKSILTPIGAKNIELVFTEMYNFTDLSHYFSCMNKLPPKSTIVDDYIKLFI